MTRLFATIVTAAVVAGCTTSTPLPDGTKSFVTPEGARITYTDASAPFTVGFKAGWGAPDYWCAAGQGANRVSGPTARIYRVTPTPQPQGADMVFSLTPPPGGAQPTGLAILGGDPGSLSVAAAEQQCDKLRNR